MFIGVTGNSGTGQTTVAGVFAGLGAGVCSLDVAGHRLLDRASVRSALAGKLCRPELIDCTGDSARDILRRDAFGSDPRVLESIESVLHPLMVRWARLSRRLLEGAPGHHVLEGALLLELGLGDLVDAVVVVTDSLGRAAERIAVRDGEGPCTARARWERQWEPARKAGLADLVIENSGTLEELAERAERLYISLTGARGRGSTLRRT